MHKLVFSVSLLLLFVSGWVLGFTSAVGLLYWRSSLPEPVRHSDQVCTCAPCLPDLWCKKCGHKSRDCPKLAWYFKHDTRRISAGALSSFTNGLPSNVVIKVIK